MTRSAHTDQQLQALQRRIAVARGDSDPDLVIAGGSVFCVFTREWLDCDVVICDGHIAALAEHGSYAGSHVEILDASGMLVVPGFIDAHVHIESSLLTPARFAETVLPHGTTTIFAEPHEIGNVLGARGVEWWLGASAQTPLDILTMVPSCVPASEFESSVGPLSVDDMEQLLAHPTAIGVGEMMNFPGVIAGAEHEIAKLLCAGSTHTDGHAPGVGGRELDAYRAAGISSDHESTTVGEAREKVRRGMWVLLREASNAHNLVDLLPLVREYGTDWFAFCTDDREPHMLLNEGHINQMIQLAVQNGTAYEDALILATINPARCHGLSDRGAVAPGFRANLAIFESPQHVQPIATISSGKLAYAAGAVLPFTDSAIPEWVLSSMNPAPVTPADFAVPHEGSKLSRVIEINPGQLLTGRSDVALPIENGSVCCDTEQDISYLAVVERHHATGNIGRGFVRGFGLQHGAIASTVAHDAHNIVVAGTNADDMATCVARLTKIGGGLIVVRDGNVLCELALPIAGLVSNESVNTVAAQHGLLEAAAESIGVSLPAPFMTLSFLALSVIPSLKLTDQGLIDVDTFSIVPIAVGQAQGATSNSTANVNSPAGA